MVEFTAHVQSEMLLLGNSTCTVAGTVSQNGYTEDVSICRA